MFPSATLASVVRGSRAASRRGRCRHHEPSLVFLVGTSVRLTDAAGAAEFLRAGECRFAFVEVRQERNFAQRAEAIGLRYSHQGRLDAINIGAGRATAIAIFRSEPQP